MGMVGVVIVGNASSNLATAEQVSHFGKAKQVMAGLLKQSQVRSASR
jgi:hypothetical protein